jgi:hypothetical protein
MKTPDMPGSFVAAIVGNIIAVAVAFGASLSPDQQKALLALSVTLGSVIVAAGTWLHTTRAKNADKITAANAALQAPQPKNAGSSGPVFTKTEWAQITRPSTSETDLAPAPKPAAKKPAAKKAPGTGRTTR